MNTVREILEERLSCVMAEVTGRKDCKAIVRKTADAKFGDYQANGVMALGKQMKTNPRQLAEKVVERLDVSDVCSGVEIAGPGFINFSLKPEFVSDRLLDINGDVSGKLSVAGADKKKKVVVDFSGPNIAKQMHVGHLRSTIIGDSICRVLEFLGHDVVRQNHIGDWGLQMGMLVFAVQEESELVDHTDISMTLDDLERRYKDIAQRIKDDPKVAQACREWTVKLQNGDTFANVFWRKAREVTLGNCFDLYRIMNIEFTAEDIRGESFYDDKLSEIVKELVDKGLAVESDGAVCVFPAGFKNKEGEDLPFIIQKSDGAFLYATTDLAALRFRLKELKADTVIYVTDARQKLHFEMLFAVARMAGWVRDDNELIHVTFGSVMGEDGRPLKTRSGENVKLKVLLDEAVLRARKIVEEKNPDAGEEQKERIAKAVGVGAVKYADYSNNRTSDYIFSFDKMLAMDGNTAPYMQYAYARIKSIERKAESKDVDIETELKGLSKLNLSEDAEIDLGKHLIQYGEVIESVVEDYRCNYLTSYLYELAQKFSAFYTCCPVLKAGAESRPTRLVLCDLTARTIRHGLSELLGIEVVKQM